MVKQLNTNYTTMRTLGSTTRLRVDIIRQTTHLLICTCSLICSDACRKYSGNDTTAGVSEQRALVTPSVRTFNAAQGMDYA